MSAERATRPRAGEHQSAGLREPKEPPGAAESPAEPGTSVWNTTIIQMLHRAGVYGRVGGAKA